MYDTANSRHRTFGPVGETVDGTFTIEPFWVIPKSALGQEYTTLFEHKTPDEKGPRTMWKDFDHYRIQSSEPAPMPVKLWDAGNSWYPGWNHFCTANLTTPGIGYNWEFGEPGRFNANLPEWYAPWEGRLVPNPPDLADRLNTALRYMLPNIKSNLSLLNSLYELKDFRSLGRTLRGVTPVIRALASQKFAKRMTVREVLRVASDVYLQQKFNISPLISDIRAIFSTLHQIRKRINALLSLEGRVFVTHYQVNLDNGDRVINESGGLRSIMKDTDRVGWYYSSIQVWARAESLRTVIQDPSVFHVELRYSFHYAEYQRRLASLLGLLDALGVCFNPAIIWNAIPWSFAIDWIVRIQDLLQNFSVGNMDPAVCIRNALWSLKRKRQIFVSTKVVNESLSEAPPPPVHLYHPAVTETAYCRHRFSLSDAVASLKVSGLNATEFSLASALALSRRGKKGRRRIYRAPVSAT